MAGRLEAEDRRRLAAQMRDMVSPGAVEAFDGDEYPPVVDVRPAADDSNPVRDLEALFPAGFYSIPKPADGDGEPIAHVVGGIRPGSVVVVLVDPRCWPTDAAQGEVGLLNADGVRLALKAAGIEITGDLAVSKVVTADGYKCGDKTGQTTAVNIVQEGGAVKILNFKGGLFTGESVP